MDDRSRSTTKEDPQSHRGGAGRDSRRSQSRRSRSRSRERERDRERDRDRDRDRGRDRDRETDARRADDGSRRAHSRSRSPADRGGRRPREADRGDKEDLRSSAPKSISSMHGEGRSSRPQDAIKGGAGDTGPSSDGFSQGGKDEEGEPAENKAKPNFAKSGLLTAETNTFNGVVLKYNAPGDSAMPTLRYRLYPFKGDEALPIIYIHRQATYLIGREKKVADIPIDHPSSSSQHAVLQYRLVPITLSDGSRSSVVKLYLIDLSSSNGTFLNGEKIEGQRFYELKERDVIKFGFSSREYVVMIEKREVNEE